MTTTTYDCEPLEIPESVYEERARYDALMILDKSHYTHNLDVTSTFIWCSDCEEFVL